MHPPFHPWLARVLRRVGVPFYPLEALRSLERCPEIVESLHLVHMLGIGAQLFLPVIPRPYRMCTPKTGDLQGLFVTPMALVMREALEEIPDYSKRALQEHVIRSAQY